MDIRRVINSKGVANKQMSSPNLDAVKQIVEEKVEALVESKQEEIKEKVEEVVKAVDDAADKAAEKVEDVVESVIAKVEEIVPGAAKVVEVVDAALVGTSVSCGCMGWKISVEKLPRSPAKPRQETPSK
jgi:ferritin-like metal-binding protein YciE